MDKNRKANLSGVSQIARRRLELIVHSNGRCSPMLTQWNFAHWSSIGRTTCWFHLRPTWNNAHTCTCIYIVTISASGGTNAILHSNHYTKVDPIILASYFSFQYFNPMSICYLGLCASELNSHPLPLKRTNLENPLCSTLKRKKNIFI